MDTSRIIRGAVGGGRYTVTAPITQWDYGYLFVPEIDDLPATYRLDFSNEEHNGTALPVYGNADGAEVPETLIDTGKDIFVWYFFIGEDYGKSVYKWRIPNKCKPRTSEDEPTPSQQSSIDQLIARSNEAVTSAEQSATDADASAQSASADADRAEQARDDAVTMAQRSANSAQASSDSADSASASATASANSASQAEQIKSEVEGMVDDAQTSADASAQSASQASSSATSASQSASSAQGYATSAQTSAQTASSKATEASGYASTASAKATEASQSATNAQGYAQTAESAKTASQTAQGLAESARDSAQGYAEDAQGYAEDAQASAESISASASQIAQNTADILKAFPTDTASGAVASFVDGADDIPLKSLTVNIDPVQDLHGYDSPWVAGGGKNLLAPTFYDGVGYNVAVGTVLTITEATGVTASGNTYTRTVGNWGGFGMRSPQLASGTYYLMAELASPNMRSSIYVLNSDMSVSRNLGNQGSGTTRSIGTVITLSGDEAYIAFNCLTSTAGDVSISTPMVALSSTATDWTPYENICPISGWEGMQLSQTRENLFGGDAWFGRGGTDDRENRTVTGGTTSASLPLLGTLNGYPFKANTAYTLIVTMTSTSTSTNKNTGLSFVYTDGTTTYLSSPAFSTTKTTIAFTSNGNKTIKHIGRGSYSGTKTFYVDECGVFEGALTVDDFKSYQGQTIPISWQTEAGTVYGGTLDVLSGVLTVDRKSVTLDANSNWTMYASGKFYCNPLSTDEASLETEKYLSNQYAFSGTGSTASSAVNVDKRFYGQRYYGRFWVYDSQYTTLESFKSALATNPFEIVYPLATPITYQLTPQDVSSLLGVNNIFADTGGTSAEYRADTTLYISRLTEPDADMIADSNITNGKYFMVGNNLYKATANIASGSAVIVGTNATRKSLSEALNEINA